MVVKMLKWEMEKKLTRFIDSDHEHPMLLHCSISVNISVKFFFKYTPVSPDTCICFYLFIYLLLAKYNDEVIIE